jgi:hypothetical protein
VVLINNSLTDVPIYMFSMYKSPRSVITNIDIYRKRMLWQGGHSYEKFI